MSEKPNKVTGVTIQVSPEGDEFTANVSFHWLRGETTEVRTPNTFKTLEQAVAEAGIAVMELKPDLEKKLQDLGVDVQLKGHGDALGFIELDPNKPHSKSLKDATRIEFVGEVVEMSCKCHKGQPAVAVYNLDRKTGERKLISRVPCESPEDAENRMQEIVMQVARRFLKEVGLTPEDASKIIVKKDDDAIKEESKAKARKRAMIDKTLH